MRPIASLELSFASPEENLACDEALLDAAESSGGAGVLRFWESPHHFVVLGYANKLADEINLPACRAHGVPVLRRCSGGGTVLQGPGCVNYSLILPTEDDHSPLASITGANHFIMERHRDALAAMVGRPVTIEGHTDLAIDGRKFSGNAQRRKRTHLLFHGSFLLNFDLALIEKFLLPPPRPPEYRRGRGHLDFVTGLDIQREKLISALQQAWRAAPAELVPPREAIDRLVAGKYSRADWNLKW